MRTLAAAALLALGFSPPAAAAPSEPASIPSNPPLAAFDPVGGGTVPLDPASGPTHVAFLATWCRPCLDQIPRLFDLEDRYKAEGYRLILVAVRTRQTGERLAAFASGGPLPGRLLFDRDGTVAAALDVQTLPLHLLVDREGRVVARSAAPDDAFASAVGRLVREEGRSKP